MNRKNVDVVKGEEIKSFSKAQKELKGPGSLNKNRLSYEINLSGIILEFAEASM